MLIVDCCEIGTLYDCFLAGCDEDENRLDMIALFFCEDVESNLSEVCHFL